MKKLTKCPLCNSQKIEFLLKDYDKNMQNKKIYSFYKCLPCKSILLNPSPSNKELDKFYPKEKYYSLGKINKGIKTKLKLILYKIYFSNKKNFLKKILFSPIKFIVRGTQIKKGLKLLDIGCGSGQFLYEMKKLGLEAYGLEPGKFNKKEAQKEKLNIENSLLEKSNSKKESFDIITLNHVLEHLNNPKEILKKISSLLKKQGIFLIGVPNSDSLAYKIFKKNWYQLDIPRHIINYNEENLSKLLEEAGFKIKKVRYNSRPSQFVVSLYYSLGIKNPNKLLHGILTLFFLPLTWIINSLKMGDQIEVWCEK